MNMSWIRGGALRTAAVVAWLALNVAKDATAFQTTTPVLVDSRAKVRRDAVANGGRYGATTRGGRRGDDRSRVSSTSGAASPTARAWNGMVLSSSAATASDGGDHAGPLRRVKLALSKVGMVCFVASMCASLPATLLPVELARRVGLIDVRRRETLSLRLGQLCARWSLRLFPFVTVDVVAPPPSPDDDVASVWVCNHASALDVFVMLASDRRMRGPARRPIKIVYWKTLENNPVTRILFRMCGFLPVEMAPNAPGEANEYDRSSFKTFLKSAKKAFAEGFDVGILPEGQLNPTPEKGLLPVFPGAYTLARMGAKGRIRFFALHGTNNLWHATDGMTVRDDRVKVRVYPHGEGRKFENADDFSDTFTKIVGHFGTTGDDLTNWEDLLLTNNEPNNE